VCLGVSVGHRYRVSSTAVAIALTHFTDRLCIEQGLFVKRGRISRQMKEFRCP